MAKIIFFVSVSPVAEEILKQYQTDSPMLPFLGKDLQTLVRNLMERFIKPAVMESATSVAKL